MRRTVTIHLHRSGCLDPDSTCTVPATLLPGGRLAVHRTLMRRLVEGAEPAPVLHSWNITHVATGMAVATQIRTQAHAERMARQLNQYGFWELTSAKEITAHGRRMGIVAIIDALRKQYDPDPTTLYLRSKGIPA